MTLRAACVSIALAMTGPRTATAVVTVYTSESAWQTAVGAYVFEGFDDQPLDNVQWQVPEPVTLALLSPAGLILLRRRRIRGVCGAIELFQPAISTERKHNHEKRK